MDIFLLYLFTRVDAIIGVASGSLVASGVGVMVLTMMHFVLRDHWAYEDKEKQEKDEAASKSAMKWNKVIIFAVIPIAIFFIVITPSQKDLALIVGGKLALDATQSETAKKVYAIVTDVLDEKIAEIAKRKTK